MELVGKLLASHPLSSDRDLHQSVVLVFSHDMRGSLGLCINKPFSDINFDLVMANAGLGGQYDEPLYRGGDLHSNRVFVVHSLDWSSPSTIAMNSNIGVSTDLSILAAISQNEGPEYFRACAGYYQWDRSQLEKEIAGSDPMSMWSSVDANIELLFEVDPSDQWKVALSQSVKERVSNCF